MGPRTQMLVTSVLVCLHQKNHYLCGCQNYGPFLGTLNNGCHIIIGTPKKDHNFDNYAFGALASSGVRVRG